jgi:hypothetical protein
MTACKNITRYEDQNFSKTKISVTTKACEEKKDNFLIKHFARN